MGCFKWKLTLQPRVWRSLSSPGDNFWGRMGYCEIMDPTAMRASCLLLGAAEPQNFPDSPFSLPPVGFPRISLWPGIPRLKIFTDSSHLWLQQNSQPHSTPPPKPTYHSHPAGLRPSSRQGTFLPHSVSSPHTGCRAEPQGALCPCWRQEMLKGPVFAFHLLLWKQEVLPLKMYLCSKSVLHKNTDLTTNNKVL